MQSDVSCRFDILDNNNDKYLYSALSCVTLSVVVNKSQIIALPHQEGYCIVSVHCLRCV